MKLQLATLALIAAAVSPAFAAPATFRGLQDTCAPDGERAQECPGVENPDRPEVCCDGLVCSGPKCVQADACAAEGTKAIECGIKQVNRPAECCPGLGCNADKFCVSDNSTWVEVDAPAPQPGLVGTTYCTWAPEYDCYETGWPACCGDDAVECPAERPGCNLIETPEPTPMTSGKSGEPTASPVMVLGASYCTWAPDYDCYETGWPACCGDDAVECPAERPGCEISANCGAVGDKTEECGADAKPGRWAECCPGLACDIDKRVCIPGPPTAMPTGMPTVMALEGASYCTWAPDYDCFESGWPACCGDDAVECPAERPECEITPEPTTTTDEPTMGSEPTMAPGPDEQLTSAAGVLVTGFATVGAVVAPLLLL